MEVLDWEKSFEDYTSGKMAATKEGLEQEVKTEKNPREILSKKEQIAKLTKTMADIEKNKVKINNILEFKKNLVNETAMLYKKLKMIEDFQNKKQRKIRRISKKIYKLEKAMAKGSNKEKSLRLEEKRQSLIAQKEKMMNEADTELVEKNEYKEIKDTLGSKASIKKQILKNEQLLSKCDIIGRGLVEGKSMDDIGVSLKTYKFKHNERFSEMIKKAKTTDGPDKAKPDSAKPVPDSATEKPETVKPETAAPTPDPATVKPETVKPETAAPTPDPATVKPETVKPETAAPTPDPATVKPETVKPETAAPKPDPATAKPDAAKPEADTEVPAPVSKFDLKHPRIAKVKSFFKKSFKLIKGLIIRKKPEVKKNDFEALLDSIDRKNEDAVLEGIANKGMNKFREELKVDVKPVNKEAKKEGKEETQELDR